MATARVSGPVLATFRRHGTSSQGNAYDLTEASVLCGDDVAKVTFDTGDRALPARGDFVDLLVDLAVFRGEPALRYKAPWSDAEVSASLAAV